MTIIPNTMKVLVVDDYPLIRSGVRRVLETHPDVTVVGEASNGLEAIEAARRLSPDVVVMDINMPVLNGVHATRVIKEERPHTRVIALSALDSESERLAMLLAGATAYLNKQDAVDALYGIIKTCPVSSSLSGQYLS